MKKMLAIFLVLLTVPILAHAQITEFYVIGVSPPTKTGCVIPGQTASETFIVTSNSSTNETLRVHIFNVSWVDADSHITIPSDPGAAELTLYASPPNFTYPRMYSAEAFICTIPPNGTGMFTVTTCLKAIYNVNVTYHCEMEGVTIVETKRIIQVAAIAIIGIAALVLLLRAKFGSTYLKKKKK